MRIKFRFKGDGRPEDSLAFLASVVHLFAASGTFDSQFTAESNTFRAENENETEIRGPR